MLINLCLKKNIIFKIYFFKRWPKFNLAADRNRSIRNDNNAGQGRNADDWAITIQLGPSWNRIRKCTKESRQNRNETTWQGRRWKAEWERERKKEKENENLGCRGNYHSIHQRSSGSANVSADPPAGICILYIRRIEMDYRHPTLMDKCVYQTELQTVLS